jgi:endonuclease III
MSTPAQVPTPSEPPTKKRKVVAKGKKPAVSMKGDWDVLPHGLGKKGDLENQNAFESKNVGGDLGTLEGENVGSGLVTFKAENVEDELRLPKDKNLGDDLGALEDANVSDKLKVSKGKKVETKVPRKKKHPYGLTPGESPFPGFDQPTKEQCYEVHQILSDLHGEVKAPKEIPAPSMDVTGCGEVPDLLDALLRTLLSAATTSRNSNMALQGLKSTFGLSTEGVGKGSINWNAVRQADLPKVIEAIKSGGIAKTKGTNIKKILDAVYEKNLLRFDALTKEKKTGEAAGVVGAENETTHQKDTEIMKFKDNLLSLDYLFELKSDEVMEELLKLPGIGVKTSSCVILFCMKRPSFAVDTHVWRHCKWLGWVPEKASRDQTFSHCEVKIPDELKYGLHQLFIAHGKKCPRCKAGTGPGSEDWETTNCPIEHLVKRSGKMKDKVLVKKSKGKKLKVVESAEEDEDDDTELSDISELDIPTDEE